MNHMNTFIDRVGIKKAILTLLIGGLFASQLILLANVFFNYLSNSSDQIDEKPLAAANISIPIDAECTSPDVIEIEDENGNRYKMINANANVISYSKEPKATTYRSIYCG